MDFAKYVLTEVGWTESAPKVTKLKLTKGRLTGGFLFFPPGPAGTLHFLARVGLLQLIPFTPGENYHLDDCVIPFALGIDLLEPPYEIELVTWNDSLSFSHALTVCFFLSLSSKKQYTLKSIVDYFASTEGYQKS